MVNGIDGLMMIKLFSIDHVYSMLLMVWNGSNGEQWMIVVGLLGMDLRSLLMVNAKVFAVVMINLVSMI